MPHEPPRIVVLGGLNYDFVFRASRLPRPGETVVGDAFETTHGGKGGNQAVAAARLLDRPGGVAMVGRVGDDWMGREMLAGLDAAGVDRRAVHVDPGATTGVAAIYVDAAGENTVTAFYGANSCHDEAEVARVSALLSDASVLLAQLETPWAVTAPVLAAARAAGTTVILDPAPTIDLPPDAFAGVDILTPNEGEAAHWSGRKVHDVESALAAAQGLRQRGPRTVVVTLGDAGVALADADRLLHLPAPRVETVSTLAAGDAFNGALAAGLASGLPLLEAVQRAQIAAALSTTRHGAQESMPDRADVDAYHA